MALGRFTGVVQDASGNVVAGASITVRREDNLPQLALIYADRAGTTPQNNGALFLSEADGSFFFHAPGGAYYIKASKVIGGELFEKEWRYEPIGLASETDLTVGISGGMNMAFDAGTSDADPGNGQLRFNHATPANVTFIYADLLDSFGSDITAWLNAIGAGRIRLQVDGNAAVWYEFEITNTLSSPSGYRKIPVSLVAGSGTLADGDPLALWFIAAGADALRVAKAGDTMTGPLVLSGDPSIALHAATKRYVDQIVAANDAMVFKGVIDCSANPNYPAADRGWTYRVSVAGKIGGASGPNVQVGDILICLTDGTSSGNHATVGASWGIIQVNIDGALTTADLGVTVQGYDADLAAIAALSTTSYGRALLTLANQAALKAAVGSTGIVSVSDYSPAANATRKTVTASIASGAAVLTATGGTFVPGDAGKSIMVPGAGAAGAPLHTTILSYTSATQVTLSNNASTTLSAVANVVLHYGTNDKTAFDNAAAAAGNGMVRVPKGNYFIGAATSSALWVVESGADILGLPDAGGPGFPVKNLSRLSGRVLHYDDRNNGNGMRFGDGDPWVEVVRPYSIGISEGAFISPYGQIGVVAASRTSDNPTANYACIGFEGIVLNDNGAANDVAWGAYLEAVRNGGLGATYGIEIDTVNWNSTVDILPSLSIAGSAHQVPLWIASGAEHITSNPSSAAMVVLANGTKFRRGIVFLDGAIDSTFAEAVVMPAGTAISSYSGSLRCGFKTHFQEYNIHVSDTVEHSRAVERRRAGNTATQALDRIEDIDWNGYNGSAAYGLANINVFQRSNFSSGNARGSIDLQAHNESTADFSQVTLNGLANKMFGPFPDNSIACGSTSFRWTQLFAATATIGTSDEKLKRDIDDIPDAVIDAFLSLKPRIFRWKESVEQKGDKARWHTGYIAQEWEVALKSAGEDPAKWALFCADPLIEMVDQEREHEEQDFEEVQVQGVETVIENGRAVRKNFTTIERRNLFDVYPLFDESGAPVMTDGKPARKAKKGKGGKTAPARAAVPPRQETYTVPRMRKVTRTVRAEAPVIDAETGEQEIRYGLRYELVIAVMDAAFRREIAALKAGRSV